jgi:hypothetical protein
VSAATDALDAMIASTRGLSSMVDDCMPALTRVVRQNIERTIAAGTTSYGEAWEPKQDGSRPLVNAANALTVVPNGRTIYVQLTGAEARHHLGRVKGKRKRGIIPERGLPSSMANDMRAVLQRAFEERTTP